MKKIKLLTIILSSILLCSCSRPTTQTSVSGMFFDTLITINFYQNVDSKIKDRCLDICENFNNLLDANNKNSDIYKINNSNGNLVNISSDTYKVIKSAIKYSNKTDYSFDYRIYPLVKLWNIKDKNTKIPNPILVKSTLNNINNSQIKLELNTKNKTTKYYAKSINNCQIDVGGIAKGYIAEKIKSYLKSKHITHAIINLGGNIISMDGKNKNNTFNNAIQNPFEKSGTPLISFKANNISIVSSGQYERNKIINNIEYGHIINPQNGYPVNNNLMQVTIIGPNSTKCDIYSTACYVKGIDKGLEFINKHQNYHAIFVDKNKKIIYSDNFPYKTTTY